MKYRDFRNIYLSLGDCDSEEMFIHERGWQDWMEEYAYDESGKESGAKITNILHAFWCIKDNIVKGLKIVCGLTQEEIAEDYGIPKRTIEDWSSGAHITPHGKACMLAFCVFTDHDII